MVKINEVDAEITKPELNVLAKHINSVFNRIGIDVAFTSHFLDQVNNERNIKQITIRELGRLFAKEYSRWGKPIAQMGPDREAVLKDLESDVNIPFVLKWDRANNRLDLVAKTVMRKKNFKTPDREFPVESVNQVRGSEPLPKNSKPSSTGFQRHPYKGRLVGEDIGSIPPLVDLIIVAVLAKTSVSILKGMMKTAKGMMKVKRMVDKAGQKLAKSVVKEYDDQTGKLYQSALEALEKLVSSSDDANTVRNYAMEIAQAVNGVDASKLERMYANGRTNHEPINEISSVELEKDWGFIDRSDWKGKNTRNSKRIGTLNGLYVVVEDFSQYHKIVFLIEPETYKEVGMIDCEVDWLEKGSQYWITKVTIIAPEYQGRGLAPKLYAFLCKKGWMLRSDDMQSGGGKKIWVALSKIPGITVYAGQKKGGKWKLSDIDNDVNDYLRSGFTTYDNETAEQRSEIQNEGKSIVRIMKELEAKMQDMDPSAKEEQAKAKKDYAELSKMLRKVTVDLKALDRKAGRMEHEDVFLFAHKAHDPRYDEPKIPAKESVTEDAGNVKILPVSVSDSYKGETFGTKFLVVDGIKKAGVDVSIVDDEVRISHIITADDSKRKGYAKMLVDDLFKEFPTKMISVSDMTEDGSAFFRSQYMVDDETGEIKKKINEAFDTKIEWVTGYEAPDGVIYAAKINDAYIELKIGLDQKTKTSYITFTRDGDYGITGKGNQMQIFGAIVNKIVDEVKARNIETIKFSASKPRGNFNAPIESRSRLYAKMANKIAAQLNFEVHIDKSDIIDEFVISKKKDDITETVKKVKGGYRLVSKFGKNLGTYPSKSGAKKREKQVQYFKHMNESYKLQLERADGLYILHILDIASGKRTEVRGKANYETSGYDANDKLHKLLDKIGKTANVSELMNGEVVTINPKHPEGHSAKAATDVAFNEEQVDELKIVKPKPADTLGVLRRHMPQILGSDYPELFKYIYAHGGKIRKENVDPADLKSTQSEFSDTGIETSMTSGGLDIPIIISSDNYVLDGHHRWLAAKNAKFSHVTAFRLSFPAKKGLQMLSDFPKATFKDIYETGGVGRIVKGVNTTVDVGPNEIKKQAAKFGNKVSRDGVPKLMSFKENMDHSKDKQAVAELKAALLAHKDKLKGKNSDAVYKMIDTMMTRVAKAHGLTGQQIHDMWVDTYGEIPDTWIMNERLTEAFDTVYPWKWTAKTDWSWVAKFKDVVVTAHIDPTETAWDIKFTRKGNMNISGEGDQFGIFATVLDIIKDFVSNMNPNVVQFSAEKEDTGTKSVSRPKLYSRMVRTFANKLGYDFKERSQYDDYVDYILIKQKQDQPVTEERTPSKKYLKLADALEDYANKNISHAEQGFGDFMYHAELIRKGHPDIHKQDFNTVQQKYRKTMSDMIKQHLNEAFDKPYKSKWEKSEYGDVDVLAKLPDGTNLSIMFNHEGDDEWNVEFYRNNSQEVTGEGDAQRIFATVIKAIQKFVKKHKPALVKFTASREVGPGQSSQSRSKLYDRLVQRYAHAWGYEAYQEDHGVGVVYELTRLNENGNISESFSSFVPVKKMLTEAQLHEAMLDSVVKWLGTNANKKIDQLSNTIITMRDAAILIKDILTDQNYFDTAYTQMVKQSRNMVKQLNTVLATAIGTINNQTIADTLKGIVQNIITFATSVFKRGGIIGFLGSLGVYAFSKYLVQNFNNANTIMKNIINSNFADQFGTFINTVINVATDKMPGLNFFSFFDTLNTIKELFFEVLGSIKKKLDFGRNISAANADNIAR